MNTVVEAHRVVRCALARVWPQLSLTPRCGNRDSQRVSP